MYSEQISFCQPAWVLESEDVRMELTQRGGHMAPVSFYRRDPHPVQPYHVSPWQCEEHGIPEGSEAVLRGDFFCLPFGHAEPSLDVSSHGRTAGSLWSLVGTKSDEGIHTLRIEMANVLRTCNVTRQFFLRDGENVIYDRTRVIGLDGAFTLGHHAVLRLPQEDSSLLVSTGRQVFGMTSPKPFARPTQGERQSLAVGASFEDLSRVPSIVREALDVDCSAYPARRGFTDLLQVAVEAGKGQPAWTAAVNTQEGYLWFALRDSALLPSTIFWIENCGRYSAPWNGRNVSLGLEDVCSFFDLGSEVSGLPNVFSDHGVKTVQHFDNDRPFVLPYVQGVLRVPAGFGHVRSVGCESERVTFADAAGKEVATALHVNFLFGGRFADASESIEI